MQWAPAVHTQGPTGGGWWRLMQLLFWDPFPYSHTQDTRAAMDQGLLGITGAPAASETTQQQQQASADSTPHSQTGGALSSVALAGGLCLRGAQRGQQQQHDVLNCLLLASAAHEQRCNSSMMRVV